MGRISFKTARWINIDFGDDADMNEIIEDIKENGVKAIDNHRYKGLAEEVYYDTEEYLTPEQNNGGSTVEVFDDKFDVIYSNEETEKGGIK